MTLGLVQYERERVREFTTEAGDRGARPSFVSFAVVLGSVERGKGSEAQLGHS